MHRKMCIVLKKLDACVVPNTGNLNMRLGLHSGRVKVGVLLGEKYQFQLFGDTKMQPQGSKQQENEAASTFPKQQLSY
jgi:hypothetical protein